MGKLGWATSIGFLQQSSLMGYTVAGMRLTCCETDPETEAQLEGAFLDYFRALAGGKGVNRVKSADGGDGLWRLRLDEIRHGEITIVDQKASGELGARVGTFRLEVAQREREVEFFTYPRKNWCQFDPDWGFRRADRRVIAGAAGASTGKGSGHAQEADERARRP